MEQPEELQEDLGRLLPLQRRLDPPDDRGHRGVADPVVDRLELLVDEEGQQVAAPHLAVEDRPHRGEGPVGDPRELDEVGQQQVQVLEGLPEEAEARLGGGLAEQLLDVGVERLVLLEVRLDVAVEAGEVHLLLGQDRGAELNDPQEDVVDQAQLLRPVAQGEGALLLVREGLVLDPEEPLEALEPHLQLEQVRRLPRGAHPLHPLAELAAQEVGSGIRRSARGFLPAIP